MQYICRVGKESFHTDSLLKCEQFFLGFGIQFFGKSPVKFKKISDQVVEYKFGLSPHSRKDLIEDELEKISFYLEETFEVKNIEE